MNRKQKDKFYEVLHSFEEEGILEHLVLVGSWCEVIYQEGNLMEGFRATTRTYDLDFLIRNRFKKIKPPFDVPNTLKSLGFEVDHQWPSGFEKYDYFGEDSVALYVEFLVAEIGRGSQEPVQFDQFGVKATSLKSLDLLSNYTITITVDNVSVNVPAPGAYVIQKMIINSERSPEKQEKDSRAVEEVLYFIKQSEELTRELSVIYNDLTKKQQKKVTSFCDQLHIDLF